MVHEKTYIFAYNLERNFAHKKNQRHVKSITVAFALFVSLFTHRKMVDLFPSHVVHRIL